MKRFEYKAVPAPTAGTKAKGLKTTEDRFALSVTDVLNELAGEGWDYVRAETLPCDERKGLTGTQTTFQNLLIFRRFAEAAAPLELEAAPEAAPPDASVGDETDAIPLRRTLSSQPADGGMAPSLTARRDD